MIETKSGRLWVNVRPQFYETHIYDDETGLSAHFISVPRRSIRNDPFADFVRPEGPEWRGLASFPDQLERTGQTFLPLSTRDARQPLLDIARRSNSTKKDIDFSFAADFVDYLVIEEVIPFEQSPLGGVSLDQLMRASGSAIGAYAGFVMAKDTMYLLIYVPLGMVVCGIASGLAHGLEESIREQIADYLGFRPRQLANKEAPARDGARNALESKPRKKSKPKPSAKKPRVQDEAKSGDPAPDDESSDEK